MANDAAQWWAEGGMFMYLVLLLGLGSLALAAVALAVRSTVVGAVAVLAVLGTGLLGGAGMMVGRRSVDQAIATVSPADQALIREVGYRESTRPVQLAGGFVVVGLPVALVGLLMALRRSAVAA